MSHHNVPYTDIFNNLSNAETEQRDNYKSLGIKNLNELNGKLKPHDSIQALNSRVLPTKKGHFNENFGITNWLNDIYSTIKQPELIFNNIKDWGTRELTKSLEGSYSTNLMQMEIDKKSGNTEH